MISLNLKENKTNFSFSLLDNISLLLEHVLNIVSTHKVDLKKEEVLVRVENFKRYDKSLINKTISDSRMYTLENESAKLKSLYQYNYEEDVDTYENRFIAYILYSLKDDIVDSYRLKEREKLPFLKAGISYGDYGTYSLLSRYEMNLKKEQEEQYENHIYILSLLRRINNLLKSEFFKRVKRVRFNEVYATNILINDKDYSFCYYYYLKNKENNENLKQEIIDNLFKLLKDKNKENLIFNKQDYLSFKNGHFVFSLKNSERLLLNVLNKEINKYYEYLLDFKINLFVKKMIVYFEGEEYSFDVKNLNYILEFLSSLTLTLKTPENICPLCRNENEDTFCHRCGARYDIIHRKNGTFAWIYNIFAVDLGDEHYDI